MKSVSTNFKKIVLLAAIFICAIAQRSNAEPDWEYWGTYKFKVKLTDKTAFIWNPKIQARQDMSEFYYWETIHGFYHKLNSHVDLGLFHLYADKKNTSGKWTDENRARTEITLKYNWNGAKISDRNRYEYRVVGAKPKSRYRNRIKIGYPLKFFTKHSLSPYVYNEFFYDFRADEYNQNRAAFGVSKRVSKIVTMDIYFMNLLNKSAGDWSSTNVLGTDLSFSF